MDKPVFFRRCHMCGETNHKEGDRIERCEHCGKSLAPFYYFDERLVSTLGDKSLRAIPLEGEYSPIQGLTAYWESY